LVPVAAAILLLAGCGEETGNGNGNPDGNGNGDTNQGGATASVTVTAEGFAFNPTELQLEPGASVELTFENNDDVNHSFTVEDPAIDVVAAAGASVTETITAPDASVDWFCKFHSNMTGTISVGGAAGAGGGDSKKKKDDDMTEGSNENDTGYDY
jgi:plastocyanin